jgi:hypothetical protein
MKTNLRLTAPALALSLAFAPAQACLHFSTDYPYLVKEGTKQALIFHDGTFAHLVLSTDIRSQHPDGDKHNMSLQLPNDLALVLPLPTKPTQYNELSENFFQDIETTFFKDKMPMQKGIGGEGAMLRGTPKSSALIVHKTETAGNYTIEPIEIATSSDPGAGQELNKYLASRKFKPIGKEAQQIYLKPGAIFLAIRLKLNGESARLRPLHITYKSDRAAFPLRLTHGDRSFDLRIYVLSQKPLSRDLFAGQKLVRNADSDLFKDRPSSRAKALPVALGSKEFKRLTTNAKQNIITFFYANGINSEYNPLSAWKDDPAVLAGN